jgi:histidinol-phosphate aminotransferase
MGKWEENVRKVVPYTPGEQPKKTRMIKLNTNENPYPPAPGVAEALKDFEAGTLRMYPDPAVSDLVNGIADFYRVKPEEVFVGVGSDDVLAMIFLTFFNSKKPVLFPDITYSFYDVWADMLRIPYETVPLDGHFCICPEDYSRENGGVIFPNPNAPTGELLPLSAVETIIAANPDVIVVVDEAYIDFGGESALPLIHKYDNLIVVQTFSKSRSLAGSRIGYAIANETLIRYLNDVKYSFNSYTMDRITIALGTKAIADRAYFEETTAKIIATREWTKRELAALGFTFGDSKSNFIFATHPGVDMVQLFLDLKQADIYVRHFDKPERVVPYLRISIGTDEEMQELVTFLREYLKNEEG